MAKKIPTMNSKARLMALSALLPVIALLLTGCAAPVPKGVGPDEA